MRFVYWTFVAFVMMIDGKYARREEDTDVIQAEILRHYYQVGQPWDQEVESQEIQEKLKESAAKAVTREEPETAKKIFASFIVFSIFIGVVIGIQLQTQANRMKTY